MPDNKVEDKINNENVNTEAVVVTSESKDEVFDLLEFVQTSTDANAIKLRKIMQYGITEEMLLATYKDIAGNVEKEESVISSLETVFSRLATYLSSQPNGIVIDLETGEIDPEASFAQAVKLGIYSDDWIVEPSDQFIIDSIKNIVNKDEEFNEEKAEEYIFLLNNFSGGYVDKNETKKDIDEFLKKDVSELSFSENLKELAQKQKDIIAESKYEHKTNLFEISDIELNVESSQGSPAHAVYLAKREKFYKEHPEYIGNVPVRKKDGTINYAEVERMNEFKEAYKIQYILSQIDEFKKITPEEFEKQPEQVKRNIIMGTVSGLKYYRKQSPEFKEIVEECSKIIESLYPGIDLSNKGNTDNQKKFADFAKKYMGMNSDIESINFETWVQVANMQVEGAVTDYIISDTEVYKGKKDISNIDITQNSMKYESVFRNYFNDSRMEFSKTDEEEFNRLYKMVNINSWIEDKDTALKFRYAALVTMRDEYNKYPESTYLNRKKAVLEQQIKEFENEHGKVGMDGDELSTETKNDFEIYREYMVHTGLIKFYTRDAIAMQDGKNYDSLDDKHKKAYIRNILVSLRYVDSDQDFSFSKVALRRLELMNTEDKEFVTFDENGEATINEEQILQEYREMSEYQYENFDELVQSSIRRKDAYVLKKLEEYTQLRDEDFLKLDNPRDLDKSIAQIEDIREKSNTERIQKQISNKELIEALKSGILEVETIDDSAIKSQKHEREQRTEDQIESGYNTDIESHHENGTELKIESIDDSATLNTTIEENLENTQKNDGNLMGRIKKAFNTLKEFINKHIKRDKKIERLGPGTTDYVGTTSLKSDSKNEQNRVLSQAELFNKSLVAEVPSLSQEQISQHVQQASKQSYESEGRITDDGSRE